MFGTVILIQCCQISLIIKANIISAVKKSKKTKSKYKKKQRALNDESLANLFMQSGNPAVIKFLTF